MNKEEANTEKKSGEKIMRGTPFGLVLLCLFACVFFGMISILFLFSCFYAGKITEVMNYYITGNSLSLGRVALISVSGLILHAGCVAGSIMMWRMRKIGYYIFSVSALIITLFQLFHQNVPISTTAVYIILILLFGLYYRKMKPSMQKKSS